MKELACERASVMRWCKNVRREGVKRGLNESRTALRELALRLIPHRFALRDDVRLQSIRDALVQKREA